MIDFFEEIDRNLVLWVNSWNTPLMDEIMWYISARWTWIPLYFILALIAWKQFTLKQLLFFFGCMGLIILLTDQLATHAFKNVFQRYRPSHNLLLTDLLHYYEISPGNYYKGGQFGFISSHAANFFALAIFAGFTLKTYSRNLLWILIAIACLVSLSRIYLGVHYFSDVFVGGLLGGLIAFLIYNFLFKNVSEKLR